VRVLTRVFERATDFFRLNLEKSVDRIKNWQANEFTGFFKYDSFTHSVMTLHPKLHIWERT